MTDIGVLGFEHAPERLPNRNQELSAIDSALRWFTQESEGNPVRIYGPSGTGKTTVATFAAREAAHEYGLEWAAVDCIATRTRAAVLHEIATGLGMVQAQHGSTPPHAYHEFLRDTVDEAVVVIDEATQLVDMSVIQEVYEIDGIAPIVVTHDADTFGSRISESLASRLRTGPEIHCQKYSVEELSEILDARLRAGGLRHSVTGGAVRLVAEMADGNARDALAILREAVSSAGARDDVTTDTVGAVGGEAEVAVVRRNLARLDTEHQVLYQIIAEAGEIRSGELADRFAESFDVPDRNRRRFLNALEYHNAVESNGSGRGTTYEPRVVVEIEGSDSNRAAL